ncbi:ABC transporter permease subunit [Thauera humireducens]|uniref:ABC transporter permease subunit n=1 Tax=Thauera humireducens TaxID=1134435 RepID=UPI00311F60CF
MPLGLALALIRISRFTVASQAVNGYIWLMRGTPLMLQLLFIYFAVPFVPVIGIRLPDFPAAIPRAELRRLFRRDLPRRHPVDRPGPVRRRQGARLFLRPDHASASCCRRWSSASCRR